VILVAHIAMFSSFFERPMFWNHLNKAIKERVFANTAFTPLEVRKENLENVTP